MQLLITMRAVGLQDVLFGVLLKGLFFIIIILCCTVLICVFFVFFFFPGVLVLEGRKTAFI